MSSTKKKAKKQMRPQALRSNEGKPRLSFVLDFPNAIAEVANVCETGAEKYARHNWKQGMPFTEIQDSLLRHLLAFNAGEDTDAESGCLHMAHVMWNAMALIEGYENHPEFDDRDLGEG